MSRYHYRRGSFFWALILIAIGVIFLAQNFNPAMHPWHVLAKYWPVLIIIWGLSKLMDYLQAHAHPETAPPSLFSGADVILLLLILIAGTLLSRLVLAPWNEWRTEWGMHWGGQDWGNPFLNSYTYTQNLSAAAGAKPQLTVNNARGDIEVQAGSTPGIKAAVKEIIRATDEAQAKKLHEQLKLQIAGQGGRYALQSNLDSLPHGGNNVRLDLALRVPKTTSAEISTERGDILLSGLRGNQNLSARSGDVHVTGVTGTVRVHKSGGATEVRQVTGDVDVSGRGGDVEIANVSGAVTVDGEFTGSVQLSDLRQTLHFKSSRTDLTAQNLTGKLDMEMGSLEIAGIGGPLNLTTRQKDINIQDFKQRLEIADKNGNISLRTGVSPAYPIQVTTQNGDIRLALPASSGFTVDATSHHGQVNSDFSAPSLVVSSQGNEPSIKGAYGKGGPMIRLSTTYGSIHLVQQSAETPESSTTAQRMRGEKADGYRGTAMRASVSKNSGKEILVQSLPRIVTPPSAINPATANAIAMR